MVPHVLSIFANARDSVNFPVAHGWWHTSIEHDETVPYPAFAWN